jgi:hypothetical protein
MRLRLLGLSSLVQHDEITREVFDHRFRFAQIRHVFWCSIAALRAVATLIFRMARFCDLKPMFGFFSKEMASSISLAICTMVLQGMAGSVEEQRMT